MIARQKISIFIIYDVTLKPPLIQHVTTNEGGYEHMSKLTRQEFRRQLRNILVAFESVVISV